MLRNILSTALILFVWTNFSVAHDHNNHKIHGKHHENVESNTEESSTVGLDQPRFHDLLYQYIPEEKTIRLSTEMKIIKEGK